MEVYAVLRIESTLKIAGSETKCTLPEGHFAIPCFSDYEQAKEMAGDIFEIVTFETVEKETE